MVLVDYLGIFFYMRQYLWPHIVVYVFAKLVFEYVILLHYVCDSNKIKINKQRSTIPPTQTRSAYQTHRKFIKKQHIMRMIE